MTEMGDIGAWVLAIVAGYLLRGLVDRELKLYREYSRIKRWTKGS